MACSNWESKKNTRSQRSPLGIKLSVNYITEYTYLQKGIFRKVSEFKVFFLSSTNINQNYGSAV